MTADEVIKFPFIDSHAGLSVETMDNFTKTGKFICESSGLYMISVTICSATYDAQFRIKINKKMLSRGLIAKHPSQIDHPSLTQYEHTGTMVSVVKLQSNDIISVTALDIPMAISAWASYISIVKLK